MYDDDWSLAGPIIEREGLTITHQQNQWAAQTDDDLFAFGPTPLIAAMRCYVASKQGEQMTTYSKNFIDSFVDAYSRNVACASDEAVRVFLQDYTDEHGVGTSVKTTDMSMVATSLMRWVCLKQGWHSRR
jgi:hypothetical protein